MRNYRYRRIAGAIGAVLLVLASAAPVLDAALHDAAGGVSHECEVCQLAVAPTAPAPPAVRLAASGSVLSGPTPSEDVRAGQSNAAGLTPPARAPPV